MADKSEWEALREFRALPSDTERLEQMFMTGLSAARTANATASDVAEIKIETKKTNGRLSKVEIRIIQVAAVIGFILVALPILLAAVALLGGK